MEKGSTREVNLDGKGDWMKKGNAVLSRVQDLLYEDKSELQVFPMD